ncbi:hypothetical protein CVS40_3409 [Lucilia cuprina]|nr:hypothetical protein CVS40_3409 [Lucilia cuprina]
MRLCVSCLSLGWLKIILQLVITSRWLLLYRLMVKHCIWLPNRCSRLRWLKDRYRRISWRSNIAEFLLQFGSQLPYLSLQFLPHKSKHIASCGADVNRLRSCRRDICSELLLHTLAVILL